MEGFAEAGVVGGDKDAEEFGGLGGRFRCIVIVAAYVSDDGMCGCRSRTIGVVAISARCTCAFDKVEVGIRMSICLTYSAFEKAEI